MLVFVLACTGVETSTMTSTADMMEPMSAAVNLRSKFKILTIVLVRPMMPSPSCFGQPLFINVKITE